MTYSILIPLRNGNPDDPRGRIPWWAAADGGVLAAVGAVDRIGEIILAANRDGCREVVLWQPFGSEHGLRVESDQIRRLSRFHRSATDSAIGLCHDLKMRAALGTGFGWPNRAWSPFGWRYGTVSSDGRWRYPDIRSRLDAREVVADLRAAKAIGFDSVWIDQLASVEGEFGDEQGSRWATALHTVVGCGIVGEAHWADDWSHYRTDMVSLGREIDARRTKPRGGKARDIVWINGHGTVNGLPDGATVRTPADQVEAGRRYQSIGFEVCYEVDSVQTMRGIVEARASKGG